MKKTYEIPPKYDVYKRMACEYYKIPMAEITPEQRRLIKTMSLGVLYGR